MSNSKEYFNSGYIASFDSDSTTDGAVIKKALILAEGTHTDSQNRVHHFPKERIIEIATNTNTNLSKGVSIPFLTDHNKTVSGYAGSLINTVQVRTITEEDVAQFDEGTQKSVKPLVGKIGIFTDKIKINKPEVAKTISIGLTTISPGIDIKNNSIREISLTPIPAISGMSLFAKGGESLTWDEIEAEQKDMQQLRDEYQQISDKFIELVTRIYTANEQELMDRDPSQLLNNAFAGYIDKIAELLELNNEELAPDGQLELLQQQQQALNNKLHNHPMYQGQPQQPDPYGMSNVAGYNPQQIQGLNFSIYDTAAEFMDEEELAEFFGGMKALKKAWKAGTTGWKQMGSNPNANIWNKSMGFLNSAGNRIGSEANNFYRPKTGGVLHNVKTGKMYKKRNMNPFINNNGTKRWGNIAAAGTIGAVGTGAAINAVRPKKKEPPTLLNRLGF